jgi:TolA-binding protein
MFRRANRLRGEDWLAAASVYRLLIDRHPASSQAGIAEMALGKRALSEGRLSEALRWFRAHQRRPESALGAEALWGEAQVLERLDRAPEARRSWRTLMQRHPTSTYASVARQRLAQP